MLRIYTQNIDGGSCPLSAGRDHRNASDALIYYHNKVIKHFNSTLFPRSTLFLSRASLLLASCSGLCDVGDSGISQRLPHSTACPRPPPGFGEDLQNLPRQPERRRGTDRPGRRGRGVGRVAVRGPARARRSRRRGAASSSRQDLRNVSHGGRRGWGWGGRLVGGGPAAGGVAWGGEGRPGSRSAVNRHPHCECLCG